MPITRDRSSDENEGDEPSSADMMFESGTADLADQSSNRPDDQPPKSPDDETASRPDDQASDRQSDQDPDGPMAEMIDVLFDGPPELPSDPPELGARSNAYISEATRRNVGRLQTALREAYGIDVTQSMITELALRMALHDAVENGGESVLARWFRAQESDSQ